MATEEACQSRKLTYLSLLLEFQSHVIHWPIPPSLRASLQEPGSPGRLSEPKTDILEPLKAVFAVAPAGPPGARKPRTPA